MSNKTCKICQERYPATTEYFYKDRDYLRSSCKSCHIGVIRKYQSLSANSQEIVTKTLQ
jgi:hypothetical protein